AFRACHHGGGAAGWPSADTPKPRPLMVSTMSSGRVGDWRPSVRSSFSLAKFRRMSDTPGKRASAVSILEAQPPHVMPSIWNRIRVLLQWGHWKPYSDFRVKRLCAEQ